ncbi:MAG: MCE family protein [Planctomycetes bacterium]|nr:MCE family protein [Planctomycetota bacterium]
MSSQNTGSRTLALGGLFLAALCVLGYYTLFLTDISWFKKTYDLQIHFQDLNGLREGDAVLVAGMRWGRIKSMEFDPEQPIDKRITVIATLEKPLPLREGAKIQIEDATLLGGRNLSIDPGPATGKPLPKDRALFGEIAPNPLDALGKLVSESQKGVTDIVSNLAEVTDRAKDGKGTVARLINDEKLADDLAEAMSRATATLGSLDRITQDLANGKGTAGQLLVNTEVYDNLANATRNIDVAVGKLSTILTDVQSGKGILGRLIEDEEAADQLVSAIRDMRTIVDRIQRGEGTLGVLVNDPTLAENLTEISTRLKNGEGTLGALLTKSTVYDNLEETTDNLRVVSGAVRNGQGSIGRLIMDDELYQQIKTALSIVQRALEEYREAAPITTFTSVFFGAF